MNKVPWIHKVLSVSMLLVLLSSIEISHCQAQMHNSTEKAIQLLHALKQNAVDVADNANLYQWKRINREVDHIAVDAQKLARLPVSATSPQSQGLQQTVRDLRSARLMHNAERINDAARRLVKLCDALLSDKQ